MKLAILSIFLSALVGMTSAQQVKTFYAPGTGCTGTPTNVEIRFSANCVPQGCTGDSTIRCVPRLAKGHFHASFIYSQFGKTPYVLTQWFNPAISVTCAANALRMTSGKLAGYRPQPQVKSVKSVKSVDTVSLSCVNANAANALNQPLYQKISFGDGIVTIYSYTSPTCTGVPMLAPVYANMCIANRRITPIAV